ncbi:MAG: Omp28-related outer membrane protein [Psychroserpens sp.]|uniref:Omp28-related outer membrane protein n=1 Tax=Psychroserpens sp. TaxID=2020870 RepID=UPI0030019B66
MKIKNFTKIFLFVAVAALVSCSSSDSGEDGGDGNNGPNSIAVNVSSFFVDFGDSVTINVNTSDGVNVTSESTVLVNGAPISGNVYTAATAGSYTITATYDNLTSPGITIQVLPVIVSATMIANETTLNLGSRIKYTVFATDSQGNDIDVTEGSNIYIDEEQSITGSSYIPESVGTISAYATFDNFTTETIMVTVEDNAATPATYNRRSLVEDYTGDWCGYCTRVAVAIEMVEDASDDVVIVATHVFNGDPYQNQYGVQMANNAGVTGLPTAIVNRQADWAFPETNNIAQVTNLTEGNMTSGVSITSASSGSSLSFMVNVGFGETINGAKLVIFLLENGLVLSQRNYYPEYYGGQDPIPNFVHNHVLRHSFTNVLGDVIPAGEAVANNTYRTKINYNIPPGSVGNPNNLEIVAMLVNSNNTIININKAEVNTEVVFD